MSILIFWTTFSKRELTVSVGHKRPHRTPASPSHRWEKGKGGLPQVWRQCAVRVHTRVCVWVQSRTHPSKPERAPRRPCCPLCTLLEMSSRDPRIARFPWSWHIRAWEESVEPHLLFRCVLRCCWTTEFSPTTFPQHSPQQIKQRPV